MIADYYSSRI